MKYKDLPVSSYFVVLNSADETDLLFKDQSGKPLLAINWEPVNHGSINKDTQVQKIKFRRSHT